MSITFSSGLSQHIVELVEQKRTLGFPYRDSEYILLRFDKYCAKFFPDAVTITQEIGLGWATMSDYEAKKTFSTRMAPVRELARYMMRKGIQAYVIPSELGRTPSVRYVPHIFTEAELSGIFSAADRIEPSKDDPCYQLVVPVLFRLLYCCGLRPTEGRTIKKENIDLVSGVIKVQESKGHKDRIVVMSEDMTILCQNFDKEIRKIVPGREYFFASARYPVFCYHWVAEAFWKCWNSAMIGSYTGNPPRPYDFRHTFATRVLFKWLGENRDLNNCLPYLSAYMGHAHFEHTAYYIHLVPDFYPQLKGLNLDGFSELIPEAGCSANAGLPPFSMEVDV